MRKFSTLALSLLLATSITSCAKSPISEHVNTQNDTANEVTVAQASAEQEQTKVMALNINLTNNADNDRQIIAAFTPNATITQLHGALKDGNETKLMQVKSVVLPKKVGDKTTTTAFHLVLVGLNKTFQPGESIPVIMIFGDGSWVQANFPIEAPKSTAGTTANSTGDKV